MDARQGTSGSRTSAAVVGLAVATAMLAILAPWPGSTAPGATTPSSLGAHGTTVAGGFDLVVVRSSVEADPSAGPSPGPSASPAVTPGPAPSVRPVTYRMYAFAVRSLPVGSRPYDDSRIPSLRYHPAYHDAAGVPMALLGGRLVYKPAGLADYAIRLVNGHRLTGDPRYLDRARDIAAVFRRIGVPSAGAVYLPYRASFAMHGDPSNVIRAPWYSAMAQGQALTFFVRLHAATGDPGDLAMARRLFNSLLHIGRGPRPWVTWIDSGRNLWLEEYAQPHPEHTLNGFMFAVFGLYDYQQATGDPNARNLLRGALTTLKRNVLRYRNPGGPSDYCLAHGRPQLKYHRIHIWQLQYMTRITGDASFASVARLFRRDEP